MIDEENTGYENNDCVETIAKSCVPWLTYNEKNDEYLFEVVKMSYIKHNIDLIRIVNVLYKKKSKTRIQKCNKL